MRPGRDAGQGDHRALPRAGPRPDPRHRPPAGRRARHLRRLHADAARLRHDAAGRRAGARHRLPDERPSDRRARGGDHRHGEAELPRQLADLRGGLPAGQQGAGAGLAVRQPGGRQHLPAHHQGSRSRRRRPRGRARARAQGVEPGLRRRGDRPLLHPRRDHGRLGQAQQRPAARRRHGEVAGDRRGAADLRLRPLHRLQGRPVGAEPGDPAAARAAQGLQPRRRRSDQRRLHPHRGRGEQARLRRPRGVLRRSRSSSTCRCRPCCRTPTTPTAAS